MAPNIIVFMQKVLIQIAIDDFYFVMETGI